MHPDVVDAPLRWRTPRRVFVNSMSDLFHQDVTDEFVAEVFAVIGKWPVMAMARQRTFQFSRSGTPGCAQCSSLPDGSCCATTPKVG